MEGDATSQHILERAGRDLAEAVIAVAMALHMTSDPVPVYPTGGLFQEDSFLVPAFKEAVRAALPKAQICSPAFEPVVGTVFWALRELGRAASTDQALIDRLTHSWSRVRWETS
jgi:N-acetylglucosamine kinase-like BadF-type ATPase